MKSLVLAILVLLAAPLWADEPSKSPGAEAKLPPPSLKPLADGVWLHVSYETIPPYGPVLSNGLVVVQKGQAILVDSAWDVTGTEAVLDLVAKQTEARPLLAILTHAHRDKMGGVAAFKSNGIDTLALEQSNLDAPGRDLEPAARSLKSGTNFWPMELIDPEGQLTKAGAPNVELFHPGPGHTRDNIVAYFPDHQILFGGCLIRPGKATSLGNTADGDVERWADTVRAVAKRFPDAKVIIPSHGDPGGRELLDHTIALAEAQNSK